MGLLAHHPQDRCVGGLEEPFRLLDTGRIDQVLGVHDPLTRCLLGFDHAVGAGHSLVEAPLPVFRVFSRGKGAGEGFLDDDVFARLERLHRHLFVEAIRDAGVHQVHFWVAQQLPETLVRLVETVLLGELTGCLWTPAVNSDEAHVNAMHT